MQGTFALPGCGMFTWCSIVAPADPAGSRAGDVSVPVLCLSGQSWHSTRVSHGCLACQCRDTHVQAGCASPACYSPPWGSSLAER